MNIVLLHYTAPPVVGGVESILARQAQLLARMGHKVRILAGRGQAWDARIPVNVLHLADPRHPKILTAKAKLDEGRLPENFKSLVDEVQAELKLALRDVDAVIAHNVASQHRNLALTAALYHISQEKPGLRTILWHHELSWASARYRAELHDGWPWELLTKPWPNARQVTVSNELRLELSNCMNVPLWQITVIPAALDISDFLQLHPRTMALIEAMDLALSAPVLLMPVHVTRRKNIELGIAALAELRKEMPEAALIVTGPPGAQNSANQQYFKQLQQARRDHKVKKAVHLLGEMYPEGLAEETVADLYRVADALLMTSREEGFGLPLLEAGLSRMPIFCSNIAQLHALAGEYATYFSPDEDPARVARLIVQRLRSDPLYQMRVKVRKEYTWDAVYQNQITPLFAP
ncbi:MAG: glycosyltransferase family 4 protein [Anaerolineaceae bacterium]|jgi:glycosyltransferase involved in cell wall biosynthesis